MSKEEIKQQREDIETLRGEVEPVYDEAKSIRRKLRDARQARTVDEAAYLEREVLQEWEEFMDTSYTPLPPDLKERVNARAETARSRSVQRDEEDSGSVD